MEATPNSVQEKINQKAEALFQKDLQNAVDAIKGNPILTQLKIRASEKEVRFFEYGSRAIFGASGHQDKAIETRTSAENTNMEVIKANLINRYIRQETEALFAKIDEIKEFFDAQE